MKRVILVAGMILWAMWLVAQAEEPKLTPEIPKMCSERNLLRDDKSKAVWFTDEQMKARATKKVKPEYPPFARTARIQGSVVLGIIVNEEGKPECIWLISGHPILSGGALEAARQWEFKPVLSKGQKVAFAGTLRINYSERQ